MTIVTNLGFPRIGAKRELKRALEAFWSGESTAASLQDTAATLRERHWQLQRKAGVDVPPSKEDYKPREWEKAHRPNLTGSPLAYRPPGSLAVPGERPKVTGDYDAWTPGN